MTLWENDHNTQPVTTDSRLASELVSDRHDHGIRLGAGGWGGLCGDAAIDGEGLPGAVADAGLGARSVAPWHRVVRVLIEAIGNAPAAVAHMACAVGIVTALIERDAVGRGAISIVIEAVVAHVGTALEAGVNV